MSEEVVSHRLPGGRLRGWPSGSFSDRSAFPEPAAGRSSWDDWFYSQRRYGLGYIPEGALGKAIAQRNAMGQQTPYRPQAAASAPTSASQWISLGPSVINSPARGLISGRIPSLAIDPTNPSTVYVAAAGGGVWKSANRGSGWVPLTDNLPSLSSGAVAVDPFSGEVWYGTGELDFCLDCYYGAGVFRSPMVAPIGLKSVRAHFFPLLPRLLFLTPKTRAHCSSGAPQLCGSPPTMGKAGRLP